MKLTIELREDNQVVTTASEPLTLSQIVNMCMTTVYAAMNASLKSSKPKERQAVKEHIFDVVNQAASNMLAAFAPEIDMRPDLTEEAILSKELELAEEKKLITNKRKQ